MRYVTFLYKKPDTLRYVIFMKFLIDIYVYTKKHDTLRYVTFLYKKLDTSQKARQFAIRFYIQKSGGGGIYLLKNNALCVTFLYNKNALFVTLLYTKSLTLCVTF